MFKKAIKRFFNLFGFDIVRKNDEKPSLPNFFFTLKEIGFKPAHIVDVGANRGYWTRNAIVYFPDAYYTLIEPQGWLKQLNADLLENEKINLHEVGVSDSVGSLKLTIGENDFNSSFIYTSEQATNAGLRQIDVPVTTLNTLLKAHPAIPDIIKVDAEGMDLKVLKGASNYFGLTEILVIESAVVSKEFDNSVSKVIAFMDANGYRLFDITENMWTLGLPKLLWFVELAFIKKGGFIDSLPFRYAK